MLDENENPMVKTWKKLFFNCFTQKDFESWEENIILM